MGVLALLAAGDRGVFQDVARSLGFQPSVVGTVQELLTELDRRPWDATLVSLSAPHTDDRVATTIHDLVLAP